MKIAFLSLDPLRVGAMNTTSFLARAAASRGHEVFLCGLRDFSLTTEDRCMIHAYVLETAERRQASLLRPNNTQVVLDAEQLDVLFLRFTPTAAFDQPEFFEVAMTFAHWLESRGVVVVNAPGGLAKASNKLYLYYIAPEFRPKTLISADNEAIEQFVLGATGPCVLKPLKGSQGQDVFRVNPETCENLKQIIAVLRRRGYVIAQAFIPEAIEGDVRLLIAGGTLLRCGDSIAAIHRRPGSGDFRSNIHAGGSASAAVITPQMERLVASVGPQLMADGVFFAGLDCIGGKLVEVNVHSIGGLHDAERFYGAAFSEEVVARLEAYVTHVRHANGGSQRKHASRGVR